MYVLIPSTGLGNTENLLLMLTALEQFLKVCFKKDVPPVCLNCVGESKQLHTKAFQQRCAVYEMHFSFHLAFLLFWREKKIKNLEKHHLMNVRLSASVSYCMLNIEPLFQLMLPRKLYFSHSHLHCNQMEHDREWFWCYRNSRGTELLKQQFKKCRTFKRMFHICLNDEMKNRELTFAPTLQISHSSLPNLLYIFWCIQKSRLKSQIAKPVNSVIYKPRHRYLQMQKTCSARKVKASQWCWAAIGINL